MIDPSDEAAMEASRAPLIDHLLELRRRLIFCIGALVVTFLISYYFAHAIFAVLVRPLTNAFPPGQGRLVYTKLYEAFFVEVKVAAFAAVFLSFPILATQLWRFVAPGLYRRERRAFLPFLVATPFLFIAGAAMAYFVVMPTAFHFFLGFQGQTGGLAIQALPSTGDYLSLVMQFIMAFGICFQLPILLMLLHRAGIVTLAQLRGLRRYMIVGATIVGAVLMPPDVMSQLLLAVPLWMLYEVAMVAIWLTDRGRGRKAPVSAEAEAQA